MQPDKPVPSAADLQIEHVRDNLYLLRGGGRTVRVGDIGLPTAGTTAAFITADGVVLVDTKLPGWGRPIIEKLKEITGKPVTAVINTHTHIDHVGGNAEFPAAIEVVAHENTAALMRQMRPVSGGPVQPNIFQESRGRGLPTRTFSDRITLGSGRDRIELRYFGNAHTSGDAWVVFPSARAVHVGDVFATKGIPPLDINNGARGVEYPETIARALASLGDIDVVITGHHQATLRVADLQTHYEFVSAFVGAVQQAKREGSTVAEFLDRWKIPEHFVAKGYLDFSHLRSLRPDVEVIWSETE